MSSQLMQNGYNLTDTTCFIVAFSVSKPVARRISVMSTISRHTTG